MLLRPAVSLLFLWTAFSAVAHAQAATPPFLGRQDYPSRPTINTP